MTARSLVLLLDALDLILGECKLEGVVAVRLRVLQRALEQVLCYLGGGGLVQRLAAAIEGVLSVHPVLAAVRPVDLQPSDGVVECLNEVKITAAPHHG